ncbi:MAG: TetR/AcrR family transcriptional regulator [Burkholderiales bacterium]
MPTPPSRTTAARPTRKTGARERSAETTRDSLLRAAIRVFAKHGLDGGSVDKISRAAKSHDRMIYYYFGNKEGLFVAVLEEIYRRFNDAEAAIDLDITQPTEALRAVVQFVMQYYQKHPEFVTLLNSENLHRGKHIVKSDRAREYSSPAIGIIERVLRSGVEQGVFRRELVARDVYMMVAALGYFYQSNRYTLSAFLGEDLEAPQTFARWEAFVIDSVLRTVSIQPVSGQ